MLLSFWQNVLNPFLESNLFIVIATFTGGYIAFRVYRNQKADEKRNAANVILLEIEEAERQLEKVSIDKPLVGGDESDVTLMEVASWDKYKHLFVADFVKHRNEWGKLTTFYAQCKEYDECVRKQNEIIDHNIQAMVTAAQEILALYAEEHGIDMREMTSTGGDLGTLELDYITKRDGFTEALAGSSAYQAPIYHYIPSRFSTKARKVLETINRSISTSDANDILQKIASPKKRLLTRVWLAIKGD